MASQKSSGDAAARQLAEEAYLLGAVDTWSNLCQSERLAAVKKLFRTELHLRTALQDRAVGTVQAQTAENTRLGAENTRLVAENDALRASLKNKTEESVTTAQKNEFVALMTEHDELAKTLGAYNVKLAEHEAGVNVPDLEEDEVMTMAQALNVDYNLHSGEYVRAAFKMVQDAYKKMQEELADANAQLVLQRNWFHELEKQQSTWSTSQVEMFTSCTPEKQVEAYKGLVAKWVGLGETAKMVKKQNTDLGNQLQEAVTALKQLQEHYEEDLERDLNKLLAGNHERYTAYEAKLLASNNLCRSLVGAKKKLEQEKQDLLGMLTEKTSDLKAAKTREKSLKKQLDKSVQDHEGSKYSLETKHELALAKVNQELCVAMQKSSMARQHSDAEVERDKAKVERDKANAERDEANAERDEAKAERDEAKAERDKAKAESEQAEEKHAVAQQTQQTIEEEHTKELQNLVENWHQVKKQLAATQQQLASKEARLCNAEHTARGIKEELDDTVYQFQKLCTMLAELVEQDATLRAELINCQESRNTEFQQRNANELELKRLQVVEQELIACRAELVRELQATIQMHVHHYQLCASALLHAGISQVSASEQHTRTMHRLQELQALNAQPESRSESGHPLDESEEAVSE